MTDVKAALHFRYSSADSSRDIGANGGVGGVLAEITKILPADVVGVNPVYAWIFTKQTAMSFWEAQGKSDEWYTPKHVFDALGCVFDMDVASPTGGGTFVPASRFLVSASLETAWEGFVWMNPPFGGRNGLVPWLTKFFNHGDGIALVPDRTSAPWFQTAWRRADAVLFTPKLKFIRPDGSKGMSPSNGTALLSSGFAGSQAPRRAAAGGLGILATGCRRHHPVENKFEPYHRRG